MADNSTIKPSPTSPSPMSYKGDPVVQDAVKAVEGNLVVNGVVNTAAKEISDIGNSKKAKEIVAETTQDLKLIQTAIPTKAPNVKVGTYIRTIATALALVNQVIAATGHNPLPFTSDQVYDTLSLVATFGTSFYSWWFNNDFTTKARIATAAGKTAISQVEAQVLSDLESKNKGIAVKSNVNANAIVFDSSGNVKATGTPDTSKAK